jgi:hypothetical protein
VPITNISIRFIQQKNGKHLRDDIIQVSSLQTTMSTTQLTSVNIMFEAACEPYDTCNVDQYIFKGEYVTLDG